MKTPHTSPIILAILIIIIIIITTYPSPPKPSFLIATCSHHPGPDAVVQRCPGSTEPSFSAACAGALKKLHNAGDHGNYNELYIRTSTTKESNGRFELTWFDLLNRWLNISNYEVGHMWFDFPLTYWLKQNIKIHQRSSKKAKLFLKARHKETASSWCQAADALFWHVLVAARGCHGRRPHVSGRNKTLFSTAPTGTNRH